MEEVGVKVAETHISTVFFTKERVYKLLKPIRTSFLDHSTVASRLAGAEDEVELNRRMAPDVYLGTADVVENGEVVDRMIVMRRLPDANRLSAVLGGPDPESCLRAVARKVAVFHSEQEPLMASEEASDIAGRDAVWSNWKNNFADLQPLVGEVISEADAGRAQHLVDEFLRHRGALFDRRIEQGFVRDGHGDLTAEDTFCMPEGPQILDCLAFDPKLRIGDVLGDVAFLVMDLDRLSGTETATEFIRWYCEFSNEHHPSSLAHHYVAYRAHVRAKVAGIKYNQGDKSAAEQVRLYHDLCLRHLERCCLSVTLVGGSPGTGKSTLSDGLSTAMGSMLLRTDELRKDLAGRGHLDREFAEPDEGIYDRDHTDRTYGELLRRAGLLLERAESVVLDASWSRSSYREEVRALAEAQGAHIYELQCVLDVETAMSRVAERLAVGGDPSDARPELLHELRTRFEPWPEATKVDTLDPPAKVLSGLLESEEFC